LKIFKRNCNLKLSWEIKVR